MRTLLLSLILVSAVAHAESLDEMRAILSANEDIDQGAKNLIRAQEAFKAEIEKYKELRAKHRDVVVAKEIADTVAKADAVAGGPPVKPKQKDKAERRAEIQKAAEAALSDVYKKYVAAWTPEAERLRGENSALRQQYTGTVNTQNGPRESFDEGGFNTAYAKLVQASRVRLDPLYRAVEKARDEFLAPFRDAARNDSSETVKSELMEAVTASAKYSQKKH